MDDVCCRAANCTCVDDGLELFDLDMMTSELTGGLCSTIGAADDILSIGNRESIKTTRYVEFRGAMRKSN